MIRAQAPDDSVRDFATRVGDFLPNLIAAAALAAGGWLVARIMRALVIRLLQAGGSRLVGGLGRLAGGRDVEAQVRRTGTDRRVAEAVGNVVFWVVFLFFVAAATQSLGLPVITTWLSGVAGYLPRVLAAMLIVLFGVLLGNLTRGAIAGAASAAGFGYPEALGRLGQGTIVLISAVVAFDQLLIEITFLIVIVAIVAGATLGGAALAFGLGARTAVSNIIASHYLLKTFRVGHRIRIGDAEGDIVEITPTAVVLGTADGRIVVPAKEFSEQSATVFGS